MYKYIMLHVNMLLNYVYVYVYVYKVPLLFTFQLHLTERRKHKYNCICSNAVTNVFAINEMHLAYIKMINVKWSIIDHNLFGEFEKFAKISCHH